MNKTIKPWRLTATRLVATGNVKKKKVEIENCNTQSRSKMLRDRRGLNGDNPHLQYPPGHLVESTMVLEDRLSPDSEYAEYCCSF